LNTKISSKSYQSMTQPCTKTSGILTPIGNREGGEGRKKREGKRGGKRREGRGGKEEEGRKRREGRGGKEEEGRG
jgi:hypothetical protein